YWIRKAPAPNSFEFPYFLIHALLSERIVWYTRDFLNVRAVAGQDLVLFYLGWCLTDHHFVSLQLIMGDEHPRNFVIFRRNDALVSDVSHCVLYSIFLQRDKFLINGYGHYLPPYHPLHP